MKKVIFAFVLVAGFIFAATIESNAQCSKDKTASACAEKTSTASACSGEKSADLAGLTKVAVKGKDGVCKVKVETAAKSVQGVKEANWNAESQLLSLDLNEDAKLEDVEKAVADAGYETKVVKDTE